LAPVFLINIILGLVGLLAAFTLLPRDRPQSSEAIDAIGAVLLGTSMLALIFGLIQGSTDGWRGVPVVSLVAGVLLFAAFAVRQQRAPNPFDRDLAAQEQRVHFRDAPGLGFFSAVSGLAYVISLFFQLVST